MDNERESFSISGPSHLTEVNWKKREYRRIVAASLVKGVYILGRDRKKNRQNNNPQALALPWWSFFNFEKTNELSDAVDHSIFGTIFKYKFQASYSSQNAPTYVIAFRGTIKKRPIQDMKANLRLFWRKLQKNHRVPLAMKAVQEIVEEAGAGNVWLAGHSLGSSMALLVGRHMVQMGFHLETYLFNPPFISAPIDQLINYPKLNHVIRFGKGVVKAGIALHRQRAKQDDPLSAWVPNLLVNPSDPICSGYIGYFEYRERMVNDGFGEIARREAQISLLSPSSGPPSHILSSADLTINSSGTQGFNQHHGIDQWWTPNFDGQTKQCRFS